MENLTPAPPALRKPATEEIIPKSTVLINFFTKKEKGKPPKVDCLAIPVPPSQKKPHIVKIPERKIPIPDQNQIPQLSTNLAERLTTSAKSSTETQEVKNHPDSTKETQPHNPQDVSTQAETFRQSILKSIELSVPSNEINQVLDKLLILLAELFATTPELLAILKERVEENRLSKA